MKYNFNNKSEKINQTFYSCSARIFDNFHIIRRASNDHLKCVHHKKGQLLNIFALNILEVFTCGTFTQKTSLSGFYCILRFYLL